MARLVFLTDAAPDPGGILPALAHIGHEVTRLPADTSSLLPAAEADLVIVDAVDNLEAGAALVRLARAADDTRPVLAVLSEANSVAFQPSWGADDFVLSTAGPAELGTRIRVMLSHRDTPEQDKPGLIKLGALVVDEPTYQVRLRGEPLDLTFKEFELLKFLATHPGRVFTRSHLLQEVWGYAYYGGTRTVDVHVRRLRAKLGPDHEALIATVRNVGYKLVPLQPRKSDRS
ncbi:MAG: response regulator transcription factor [Actinomycetota bacterium]